MSCYRPGRRICATCEEDIVLTGNGYWVTADMGLGQCWKTRPGDIPRFHMPVKESPR